MAADHVDALAAVLGEETRACEALVAVLREEQAAVVALRPQAIASCLERRRELEAEIGTLAERRRVAIREVAGGLGANVVSAIALLPHFPPALRAPLETRIRGLRSVLLAARALERQNAMLAASSLESVGEMLGVLRSVVPGARYGADARMEAPAPLERVDRRV